jgi:hypothetical protein
MEPTEAVMAKSKHGQFVFTVEGSGAFPFDMLRYDACWPYSEGQDSCKLEHYAHERRRVVLATHFQHAPTHRRWESFNWKVVGLGEQRA